jgi:SAM-dependent methyltransferase
VLDVCCGPGRHARLLATRGYQVTGVDASPAALERARVRDGGARYVLGDMRELHAYAGAFDAVLCLWQSFGYFDAATNRDVLRQMAAALRPGGRLALDIFHRTFFEQHQGTLRHERGGHAVVETKQMIGDRLTVRLDYGDTQDTFEWQLFTPEEVCAEAAACGLAPLVMCSGFDTRRPASAEVPRMQVVWEKKSD